MDSIPIPGATDDMLEVSEEGNYFVEYTSPEGCFVSSDPVFVGFTEAPAVPEFTNIDNVLTVTNQDGLPIPYTLNWYLDGGLVFSGAETTFCAETSGLYTLEVVDLTTGCSNTFEMQVEVDPDFPCVVSTEEAAWLSGMRIYPNPFNDLLVLELPVSISKPVHLALYSLEGKNGLARSTYAW